MNKTLKEILAEIRNWRYASPALAYIAFTAGIFLCAPAGYAWFAVKIANGVILALGGFIAAMMWIDDL